MAGIPTESPLVLRESLASSHNRLTSAEDYARSLTFGLSGLLDARNICHAEKKGNRRKMLTPAYPANVACPANGPQVIPQSHGAIDLAMGNA